MLFIKHFYKQLCKFAFISNSQQSQVFTIFLSLNCIFLMETPRLVPGTGTRPGVMTVSLTEGFLCGLGGLSIRLGTTNKDLCAWRASRRT